ncbi:non-ribosomal peptide synthetase [Brevibacillus laterosporus]|uniref:non-ribosomal peptide synthetase n=1 Tax=Brevibacillus laterosporus TaxID=1465 RepID=UPI0003B1F5C6|nr:non-ribosomal peptide synthetase [Brevibacillus laterosporus]ERM15997.1 tyrocidine synthase 3 [Brevibacillus laterosporus PE36]
MEKKPEVTKIYPLTPLQEGILFHSIVHKDSGAYFQSLTFSIEGHVDIDLFLKSVNVLIERHDILRTAFVYEKVKKPMQLVLKKRELTSIHFEDISRVRDQEEYVQDYLKKDKTQGFHLSKEVLIRIAIFQTSKECFKVVWSYHHLIMDGWSLGIMFHEFLQIYDSFAFHKTLKLEPVHSYQQFIQWLEKQDNEQAKEYWGGYLEGYDQLAVMPSLINKTNATGYEAKEAEFEIDIKKTQQLTKLARQNNATLSTVWEAIWGLVLQRYNNVDDVVFGSVVSGRNAEVAGINQMIGLFINTVPVRIRTDRVETFGQLVQMAQESSTRAKMYDFFPLYEMPVGTKMSQGIIDHVSIFQKSPIDMSESSNDSGTRGLAQAITHLELLEQTNYDFSIMVITGESLIIRMGYNANLHSYDFIKRIFGHIEELIEQVITNPEIELSQLKITTLAEENELLERFNDTMLPYDRSKTIHELIALQAKKTPDQIAVVCEGAQLTYRELDEQAKRVACSLIDKGVGPNTIVGLMTERSLDMMIGLLAILKAGGAYLPIDPTYPEERVKYMLTDSGATLILTQRHLVSDNQMGQEYIYLDETVAYEEESLWKADTAGSEDLAYVIYTSGSTGQPKGVMIPHRAVHNFIQGITEKLAFTEGKSILALTTISFDIFVLETLVPLTQGMRVVVATEAQQRDPKLLNELIKVQNINSLQLTPSRLQLLLYSEADCFSQLEQILIGGEALLPSLLAQLKERTQAKIFNMYGPTETTIWSLIQDVTNTTAITIGKPIANTQAYILNQHNSLQPIGMTGELCLAGDGLSKGYLNREEQTSEKFVINPFQTDRMMYRTGDLARWLPDGTIEFKGRIDHQIKIRGFRVELGEIESCLVKHPAVHEAVVIVEEVGASQNLTAYYVGQHDVNPHELRQVLSQELPEYMVPAHFVFLKELPLTANGKIDRKQLPKLSEGVRSSEVLVTSPHTEVERELVEIWKNVLKREVIGLHESFFDLGGNSILLVQMHAQVDKKYAGKIDIGDVFSYSTIAKLASYIESRTVENLPLIQIPAIQLPSEYFNVTEGHNSTLFTFAFQEEMVAGLHMVADRYSVEIADILLAMNLYLYAEVGELTDVTLQLQTTDHRTIAIHVNMNSIEDFGDLFRHVREARIQPNPLSLYSIQSLEKSYTSKKNEQIWPLFTEYSSQSNEFNRLFDLIFELQIEPKMIAFECRYDQNKLNHGKVEELIYGYLKLLSLMLENEHQATI